MKQRIIVKTLIALFSINILLYLIHAFYYKGLVLTLIASALWVIIAVLLIYLLAYFAFGLIDLLEKQKNKQSS